MPAFQAPSVVQAFNLNSDFAKLIYGTMLQSLDPTTASFFNRHGMITKTSLDMSAETPIQCVDDFETQRIDKLQVHIGTFLGGTPIVGARTPAREGGRTIPQTIFQMQTVDMYSQGLELPTSHEEAVVPITIFMNYGRQLRSFWERVVEKTILIVATGMRGAGENWASLETIQQQSGGKIEQSEENTFTDYMRKLHAVNKITPPYDQHSSWATGAPRDGTMIDATGATSTSYITFTQISQVKAYLDTRTAERRNIGFEKPMINVRMSEGEGSTLTGDREWAWIITPEVASDIRRTAGSTAVQDWGQYQFSRTEGGQLDQGIDTSSIGRIFGISFIEHDGLPRYWGGSGADIPVARTMIFGKQAVAYGFRRRLDLGARWTSRFNNMSESMRYLGVPYKTWTSPQNQGQYGILKSSCDFGVAKIRYEDFYDRSKEIDRGVFAFDTSYTSLEASGTL